MPEFAPSASTVPWVLEMIQGAYRFREPRMREREVRIEFDRLIVKIYRRL